MVLLVQAAGVTPYSAARAVHPFPQGKPGANGKIFQLAFVHGGIRLS